jgi:uroporphyrinogen decarboxylase
MGHLMPLLNELGINEVNLGPSLHPQEIRAALPNAIIHGQMPPMTLRAGGADEIRAIVQRDFDTLGYSLFVECTSGVTSAGTAWEHIRLYMQAVAELTQREVL